MIHGKCHSLVFATRKCEDREDSDTIDFITAARNPDGSIWPSLQNRTILPHESRVVGTQRVNTFSRAGVVYYSRAYGDGIHKRDSTYSWKT